MKRIFHILFVLNAVALLTACSDDMYNDSRAEAGDIINVSGIESDELNITTEVVTRAVNGTPAEQQNWLLQPLKDGLDITFGKSSGDANEEVAILKLIDSNTAVTDPDYDMEGIYAKYSFFLRDKNDGHETTNEARWKGNGAHYFKGVYVPNEIRYSPSGTSQDISAKTLEEIISSTGTAPDLISDQSGDNADATGGKLGNYTLLSHYLGMPTDTRISATIERILLPFRHRLCRVLVYVLIDPALQGAKINGYMKDYTEDADKNKTYYEDPKTSDIHFRNCWMLRGVKDEYNSTTQLHTLTPQWGEKVARITPHFVGEHGSPSTAGIDNDINPDFILFIDGDEKIIFPTSTADWTAAKTKWVEKYNAAPDTYTTEAEKEAYANEQSKLTRVNYGKVPVYDIIARPTYSSTEMVMYDENFSTQTEKEAIASLKNQIDFDITLDNGLQYEKTFEFDLDANSQTVVYLRISRESIDYNSSGSELWINNNGNDGWYGLNNQNGNTLSKAGSSWQRAYTYLDSYSTLIDTEAGVLSGVTDGDFYTHFNDKNLTNAQYYSSGYSDKWIEKFLQAYKGGEHHGDYFILKKNIQIDATKIPKDFVFTGHLDAQDCTIELTNTGKSLYKTATSVEGLYTENNGVYTSYNTPSVLYRKNDTRVYYKDEDLKEYNGQKYDKDKLTYYTDDEINAAKAIVQADGYEEGTNPVAEETAKHNAGEVKSLNGSSPVNVGDVKSGSLTFESVGVITLELLLGTEELYTEQRLDHPFSHPSALYQFSHISPSYLFAGLNGTYTTTQETASDPYAQGIQWEANVHKESNTADMNGTGASKEHWVPTLGYRAEVLNVRMVSPAKLFKESAEITGNVQNCFNNATPSKETAVTHTPNIPQYK